VSLNHREFTAGRRHASNTTGMAAWQIDQHQSASRSHLVKWQNQTWSAQRTLLGCDLNILEVDDLLLTLIDEPAE